MIRLLGHLLVRWEDSKREISHAAGEQLAQFHLVSCLSYSKYRIHYQCNYMFKACNAHSCYTRISRKNPQDTEILNSGALIVP